jgi:hypothetical protein
MNFLITICIKRKLIVVVVRHYVCKMKFWFGGLIIKYEGIRPPFRPIFIDPLILKMNKYIVMSMHVCVCCVNKLILIVCIVIMLVTI